jgi:GTP-binding protein
LRVDLEVENTVKLSVKFLTSAADPLHFPPPGPPEIAFLGRSNVGKSSLINSLLDTKIAHVSSTPGRTRTINFIALRRKPEQLNPDLIFADLPGYGYAKLPRALTAEWPKFIEPYLDQRPTLALCVCLVDVNVPPQASDIQLIEWLRDRGRPFLVVATKSDRLSGNKLRGALMGLGRALKADEIVPYSSKTGAGGEELWRAIRAVAMQDVAESG